MESGRSQIGHPARPYHPLRGDEMRALRKLQRENGGSFVFVSERGTPFTTAGFARMLERAAEAAGIEIKVIRTCCVMLAVLP
jgi:hypothetical protein